MSGTICCVLKSGGDFLPAHVEWLRRQCAEHMPFWDFRCWSDMDVPGATPLKRGWPKWWSKFEIYETPFDGPALVIDLDTVFVGTLNIRAEHADTALVMRDPWKDGHRFPERLGGGFMYLPEWTREFLRESMEKEHHDFSKFAGNDQVFLHEYLGPHATRLQDEYPDELVSYKVHVMGLGLQPDNKVVYFHGKPRPWDIDAPWIPKLQEI